MSDRAGHVAVEIEDIGRLRRSIEDLLTEGGVDAKRASLMAKSVIKDWLTDGLLKGVEKIA